MCDPAGWLVSLSGVTPTALPSTRTVAPCGRESTKISPVFAVGFAAAAAGFVVAAAGARAAGFGAAADVRDAAGIAVNVGAKVALGCAAEIVKVVLATS